MKKIIRINLLWLTSVFCLIPFNGIKAQPYNHSPSKANLLSQNSFLGFEENLGQISNLEDGLVAEDVRFIFRGNGVTAFILDNGIAYQFQKAIENHTPSKLTTSEDRSLPLSKQLETFRFDVRLKNANHPKSITKEGKLQSYNRYYTHHGLLTNTYQKILFHEIYPGIDWQIYITDGGIKYDFIVHPGASAKQIQLEIGEGVEAKVSDDGTLTFETDMGFIREDAPISFQSKNVIKTQFVLENNLLQFELDAFDPKEELIIDPSISWGTYYGGPNYEYAVSCKTDLNGNVYLLGYTFSTSGIAANGHRNYLWGNTDVFLIKFDSLGNRIWGTYYGGESGDEGHELSIDPSGNIFISGSTYSSMGIDSLGFQSTKGGDTDGFLAKFNASGALLWGTYCGGLYDESVYGCETDLSGNVYLSGYGVSPNNIASNGFRDSSKGSMESFIVKYNSNGDRIWGTYFGGPGADYLFNIASDKFGYIYLAGYTTSDTFITYNSSSNIYQGNEDAFIAKFDSSGHLVWSSYFGAGGMDEAYAIAIDDSCNIYIGGNTSSSTGFAYQGFDTSYAGKNSDAFIAKFDSSGSLSWSSYYGGPKSENFQTIGIHSSGLIYAAGSTQSDSSIAWKAIQNYYPSPNTLNGFIVQFSPDGRRNWASYIGGNSNDEITGICVENHGYVYACGITGSSNNIGYKGFRDSSGGNIDAFLLKIKDCYHSYDSIFVNSCNAYYWNTTQVTYSVSGTYYDTLSNYTGCDSIICLHLTITSPSLTKITQTSCDSFSWSSGKVYYQSGTYYDTLANSIGCDSVIILDLTLTTSKTVNLNQNACDSFLWDGSTYIMSGTYSKTFSTKEGCDSVVNLGVNIANSFFQHGQESSCISYYWPISGQNYSASGNYKAQYISSGGCDSIYSLSLTIQSVDKDVLRNNFDLIAQASGAQFHWLDCNNNYSIISGANTAIYSVTKNGNYAVEVTQNMCIDTSQCFTVSNVGLGKDNAIQDVIAYPNPFSNVLYVDYLIGETSLRILSISGQVLMQKSIHSEQAELNLEQLPSGVYILEINSANLVKHLSLIKN